MNIGFLIFLGFLFAGTIALPFFREHRFALIIWAPVLISDVLVLHGIFGILPRSMGHSPDSGFVGMAVGFYLAIASPIILAVAVSLIVAAFALPRKIAWNLSGVIGGLIASSLAACVLIEIQTPTTSITVLDGSGKPIPGVEVHFSTFHFDLGRSLGIRTTDLYGRVTIHLPPNGWSAAVSSINGMESSVGVGSVNRSGAIVHRLWWRNKDWGKTTESLTVDVGKENHFDLPVREPGEVVSPWLTKELHRLLLETLNDGQHARVLQEMCDNLESFSELDLLGKIAAKNQSLSTEVAGVLRHDANIIQGFRAGLLKREGKKPDNSVWPYSYGVLCQWRGLSDDSQHVKENIPKLHEDLTKITNELLTAAEPLWAKNGPVAFAELGKLAKPAVPRLLRAMETADEHLLLQFLTPLKACQPDVDQVRPFFGNDNPFVAFTAISAVQDKLTAEEAKSALEKLHLISHPDTPRNLPDPTYTESSVFQHQLIQLQLQQNVEKLIAYMEAKYSGPAQKSLKPPN
jgi:hypothetical protein